MEELAAKLRAAAKRAGKIVSKERRVLLTFPTSKRPSDAHLHATVCVCGYACGANDFNVSAANARQGAAGRGADCETAFGF